MIWQDLLIKRDVTDEEAISAIAEVFKRCPENVTVCNDLRKLTALPDAIHILLERFPVTGDFLSRFEVILRDDAPSSMMQCADDVRFVGELAQRLGAAIYIGDTSLDPSSGYLIHDDHVVQHIHIGTDDDEYQIWTLPVQDGWT